MGMKTVKMHPAEVSRVCEMLEYRRLKRSQTEIDFITRYLDTVPGMYADEYGNRLLLSTGSKVLISCHTDSVHKVGGKQAVKVSRDGIVALSAREITSNCLGADDAAGIYAALRMIEAGVKVSFIFHRDEECGGRGSHWLALHYADWLSTFDVCLALDRRGTEDVIVTQSWSKCASSEFAAGLADQLGMSHRAADGIFTDSANYVDLIPECSNLSIGYRHEHTEREILDLHYLETVIRKLIAVDWDAVPVVRKAGDDGYRYGRDATIDFAYDDNWLYGDKDTTICDVCKPYGNPGYLIHAGQQIRCWGCNQNSYGGRDTPVSYRWPV
jgi:hypothetical protein